MNEGQNSNNLRQIYQDTFDRLQMVRLGFSNDLRPREIGTIQQVTTGIVTITGLPDIGYGELLKLGDDHYGIAFDIQQRDVGVVLLTDYTQLETGVEVKRTGSVVEVPVGHSVIGRVVDPLGRPLDGKSSLRATEKLPIDRPAPEILDRAAVTSPLQTGIKVIDALVPIGRGQRELILGDRQIGKTSIAVDTILNQKDQDVICIYCAIGQHASSVAKVIDILEAGGAIAYTTVVVTEGDDPPGLLYIAPYAATSMGEYFMEQGKDVLVVYDDLTHHAWAYREISLLLKRPPGREAYPGDIFLHSFKTAGKSHTSM